MLLVRQQDSELGWSESQDLINVLWGTGEAATLHILVVHAQESEKLCRFYSFDLVT